MRVHTSHLSGLNPLGFRGQRVISLYAQVKHLIRSGLGEEFAQIFAEPVLSESGDQVDWYVDLAGDVEHWQELGKESRHALSADADEAVERVRTYAKSLKSSADALEQGELLELALSIPGPEAFHRLGGQVVLAPWGFERDGSAGGPAELSGVSELPSPPPIPAGPIEPDVQTRKRVTWWWLPWILSLLTLLLIAMQLYCPLFDWLRNPPIVLPEDNRLQEMEKQKRGLEDELERLKKRYAEALEACKEPDPPEPPPKEPEPEPEPEAVIPPEPKHCDRMLAPNKKATVVFAVDGSSSMAYPADWTKQDEQKFKITLGTMQFLNRAKAEQLYNKVIKGPGLKRRDRALESVANLVPLMPGNVTLGLVEFGDSEQNKCGVKNHGFYGSADRERFKKNLYGIKANASTPLASGIRTGGNLLKGSGANDASVLIVVSDGEESCGGNPCSAAKRVKKQLPGLKIMVIDMVGNSSMNCIAEATGGRVYRPQTSANLADVIKEATIDALKDPECR